MEIPLMDCVYAINPRRIIAIQSYRITEPNGSRHENPFHELNEDEDEDGAMFLLRNSDPYVIIIHMTDDFSIEYRTKDNSEYEKLRDELKSIVGG